MASVVKLPVEAYSAAEVPADAAMPDRVARASLDCYFTQHLGITLAALTAPIPGANPCGESLRGGSVYREIQEARRQDDETLPLGPWVHELKRAQWDRVSELAADALTSKSKDLQLAAWLLEAGIHLHGFAALAPCLTLTCALCEQHWEFLYPRAEDADVEFRTNVIHWANDKLLPALRLVPLTQAHSDERPFSWADWEHARRNEQHLAARGDGVEPAGVTAADLAKALAGTATEWLCGLHASLESGREAVEALDATLNDLCGNAAPSLQRMDDLLGQIQALLESALRERGVSLEAALHEEPTGEPSGDDENEGGDADREREPDIPRALAGEIRDRASAYARLAELADVLQRLEPHSPVPYLLKRAVSWGRLSTAELYQEMFITHGGRLDIFELLGVAVPAQQETQCQNT
jgi:type VI secretion system protein ImpA